MSCPGRPGSVRHQEIMAINEAVSPSDQDAIEERKYSIYVHVARSSLFFFFFFPVPRVFTPLRRWFMAILFRYFGYGLLEGLVGVSKKYQGPICKL